MLSMAFRSDAVAALELRSVQMPLRPASPENQTAQGPSRECHRSCATCMRHCSPACPLSSGEAKAAPVMVMLYVALHCEGKHKQDAHVKPTLVAVMLRSCTMTEVQQVCAKLKNFSHLQNCRNRIQEKRDVLFQLQSRKSTRKYPHAWQVFGRSLPETTLQAPDWLQTASNSFSG